jgi:hypothetical protein
MKQLPPECCLEIIASAFAEHIAGLLKEKLPKLAAAPPLPLRCKSTDTLL